VERDDALALSADVDHDLIVVDLHHGALDDLSLAAELSARHLCFEECCEAVAGGVLTLVERFRLRHVLCFDSCSGAAPVAFFAVISRAIREFDTRKMGGIGAWSGGGCLAREGRSVKRPKTEQKRA